jgi:hypothetical protein
LSSKRHRGRPGPEKSWGRATFRIVEPDRV